MPNKKYIILLYLLSSILGITFSLYRQNNSSNSIQLATTTRAKHQPVSFIQQIKGDPQAGEKIFKSFCAACHDQSPKIKVNAPLIGNKKLWQSLNKLGQKKLLAITISGKGAMPARGGCFECSDEQLSEAITYLTTARM